MACKKSHSVSQPPSHAPSITHTLAPVLDTGGNITNNSLPSGIDLRIWHWSFIPTIIQYIACQANPWAITPLQMVLVMQTVWDIFFSKIPQTIAATCLIYQLVCGSEYLIMTLNNIYYSFRLCNVLPTRGIVQLVQLESWSLLHSLMPIWNCIHLTVIAKNGQSGTLKISVLHMSLQMAMTNRYVLDSCTAHLLTTLSRCSKECSGAHWFYRHLVLTGLLSLVPESWMESMTQTFPLESLSGDLVLLLHPYVQFLHIMQY